jgi:hypothetical protein
VKGFRSITLVCSSPSGNSFCLQRLKEEIAEVANEIESLGSTEER